MSFLLALKVAPLDWVELLLWLPLTLICVGWMVYVVFTPAVRVARAIGRTLGHVAWKLFLAGPFRPRL